MGFNELFIWLFTEKAQIYYLYCKIIAGSIVFFWNFLSRRFILFK